MRHRIILSLLFCLAIAATASAQERRSEIPLISVVGNGEVRVAPAVAEAKRKANAIADALGVRLVRVQDAEEGGVRVIPPMFGAREMSAAATATPVEPGQISVTATITLRYAITEGK